MSKSVFASAIAAALLAAGPSQATGINRIWVSGHGTDTSGCGAPTTPCRSLQYAHDQLAPGGEVDILDPAGYGAIAITKAISIVNDGVGTAGVQATSGAAITINAAPTDAIYLRGLNIDGVAQSANFGVLFNSGEDLTIVGCVVRHFAQVGIELAPNVFSTNQMNIRIANTTVADNGTFGLQLSPLAFNAGSTNVLIDQVIAENNNVGIGASVPKTEFITLVNAVASNNRSDGVSVSGPVVVSIDRSVFNANAQSGVHMVPGTRVSISRSMFDQNSLYGVRNDEGGGGALRSTGDSRAEYNGTAAISGPAPTVAPQQ